MAESAVIASNSGPIAESGSGNPGAAILRRAAPYLLLAPSLLLLVLFTYWPILQVAWQSLHGTQHGQVATPFVGLNNYARLFADGAFRAALFNNLLYAFGTVIPSIVIALFLALALERSSRISSLLRTVFFMPSLIPLVGAAALCLFIFMPQLGLLDYYLAKLGLHARNWLGSPETALLSLIGLTVWKNAGYFMLFYLAGLQAIPRDAQEAAVIEGANAWQRLWHVTLPLLRPTTAFVTVIAVIQAVTTVDHVIVLTKGGPFNSTNLLLYYIYQTAQESFDFGKAAAATVISLAMLLGVSLVSLRRLEQGMRHVG